MLRKLLCDTILSDRKEQSFRKHLLPESSGHKANNARIVRTVTGKVCVIWIATRHVSFSLYPVSVNFITGRLTFSLFHPEDGWISFLQNVGLFCQTTQFHTTENISLRENLKSQTIWIKICLSLRIAPFKFVSRYSFGDGDNKIMNMAGEIVRMLKSRPRRNDFPESMKICHHDEVDN